PPPSRGAGLPAPGPAGVDRGPPRHRPQAGLPPGADGASLRRPFRRRPGSPLSYRAVTRTRRERAVADIGSREELAAMIEGKPDGMQAFMTGKLKLSGDMMFAQSMQAWFAS